MLYKAADFKNGSPLRRLVGSVGQASDFGSSHDLTILEFEPHGGLRGWSLLWILCLSLSAPPVLTLCLSLSKINIKKNFFNGIPLRKA